MVQDKVHAFVPKDCEEHKDNNPLALYDTNNWWADLPGDVRVKTPFPKSLCSFDIFATL